MRRSATCARDARTSSASKTRSSGRSPASAGPGCEHCKHTGYSGRVPIAELLTPSDELRDAIVRGATAHEIRAAMRAGGTPTMRDHAMRLVVNGVTSIDEVNRVLSEDV